MDELEQALLEAEETRRRLHNQVQELRGNVRVFCRVRPTTDEEVSDRWSQKSISRSIRNEDVDAHFTLNRRII